MAVRMVGLLALPDGIAKTGLRVGVSNALPYVPFHLT